MIFELILFFLIGFLIKAIDLQVDKEVQMPKNLKYFLAVGLGILSGYLVGLDARFAGIWVGLIAANVLMGKVDDKAYWLGIGVMLGMVLVTGFAGIVWISAAGFFVFGFMDEFLHGKKLGNKVIGFLAKNRLFAWIGIGLMSVYLQEFVYIAAIICIDLGYMLGAVLLKKYIKGIVQSI